MDAFEAWPKVFPQLLKARGFKKDPQHKENTENYLEFGDAIRNMGVKSSFSRNFWDGKKPEKGSFVGTLTHQQYPSWNMCVDSCS